MGAITHIQWADHTFNPWEGCAKVSPGCAHCYAEARNARFGGGTARNWGKGAPRRRTSVHNWNDPIRWNRAAQKAQADSETRRVAIGAAPGPEWTFRRPRVFCASLADWLDDEVPAAWLGDLLALIKSTPNLDWLLLTKRPESFRSRLVAALNRTDEIDPSGALSFFIDEWQLGATPFPNVWIGTTVEDQQRAYERIPRLLSIPAKVRFLSCEPLLGPVDLAAACGGASVSVRLDWVICGGESGAGARPMHPHWARSLRDQCQDAAVPFFFKQWGEWLPGSQVQDVPDHNPKKIIRLAMDGTQANEVTMPAEKRSEMKCMCLVGKKIAGRLLDGVEHNEFP